MSTRTSLTLAAVAAGLLALTACGPTSTTGTTAPSGTGTAANAPAATASTTAPAKAAPKVAVPNLVGKGLQTAQDTAQTAGFYNLTSHDALGRGRAQILDRDWKVCSQSPAAGTGTATSTKLDFGAVKLTEACPKTDQKPPAKAGKTMPNYVGKGLKAARASLPSGASVTVKDATGDRMILLESNWKVCTQDPKAGATYTGQPATFTAVKTDESCP